MPTQEPAVSSLDAIAKIFRLIGIKLYSAVGTEDNPEEFAASRISAIVPQMEGGAVLVRIDVSPSDGDAANHGAYQAAKLLRTVARAAPHNPGFGKVSLHGKARIPSVSSVDDESSIEEGEQRDFIDMNPFSIKVALEILNDRDTSERITFAGFTAMLNVKDKKAALMSAVSLYEELRRGGFLEPGTEAARDLAQAGSLQPWDKIEIDENARIIGKEDGRILDKITKVYEKHGVRLRESGIIIPDPASLLAREKEDRSPLSRTVYSALEILAANGLVISQDLLPSAEEMDKYREARPLINPEKGTGRSGLGGSGNKAASG